MAFAIAKYWGIMPHVIWRYPFRYFKELRDHVVESARLRDPDQTADDFDWEEESKTGPPV